MAEMPEAPTILLCLKQVQYCVNGHKEAVVICFTDAQPWECPAGQLHSAASRHHVSDNLRRSTDVILRMCVSCSFNRCRCVLKLVFTNHTSCSTPRRGVLMANSNLCLAGVLLLAVFSLASCDTAPSHKNSPWKPPKTRTLVLTEGPLAVLEPKTNDEANVTTPVVYR